MFGGDGRLMVAFIQEVIRWLYVLIDLGAAVTCAAHVRRSPWAWALTGGFLLEAGVTAWYQVAILLLRHNEITAEAFGRLNTLLGVPLGLLGLMGKLAIVGGVGGILLERERARA